MRYHFKHITPITASAVVIQTPMALTVSPSQSLVIMAQNNGPRVDFGKVTTTRVQPGISASADIAVLRQDVVTTYPAASAGNNKVASLFGGSDFGDGQTFSFNINRQ